MKTVLETKQLEFNKSSFLIELVKHENGLQYIEINQQIIGSKKDSSSLKINPSILSDIIKTLQTYQTKITSNSSPTIKHISDSDQLKIQKIYLKGISIKDLAMQFNQSTELIEMILRNKGIVITDNEQPKPKYWRKRRR